MLATMVHLGQHALSQCAVLVEVCHLWGPQAGKAQTQLSSETHDYLLVHVMNLSVVPGV